MKIHQITSSSYSVFEHRKGVYWLVKVIGEYSSKNEAYSDMLDIMNNKVTEQEVEWKHQNEII
jgi:hypothetical protein